MAVLPCRRAIDLVVLAISGVVAPVMLPLATTGRLLTVGVAVGCVIAIATVVAPIANAGLAVGGGGAVSLDATEQLNDTRGD